MRVVKPCIACLGVFLLSACLDPLSEDDPGYSPHILDAGERVPLITENPALASRVDNNDQVTGSLIGLRDGWAGGAPVRYWDFGESPEFTIPVWLFRECDADGNPVGPVPGHPNTIDAVPGDVGYSPLWTMVIVCVNPGHTNRVFPSFQAIRDGVEIGYIREPRATDMWANCPVYLPSMGLEVGAGNAAVSPEFGYYKGVTTHYYHPGGMANGVYMEDENGFPRYIHAFVGRLSDGSTCDPVFEVPRDNENYSPLVKVVEVQHSSSLACQTNYDTLLERTPAGGFAALVTDVEQITPEAGHRVYDIQHTFGLP